MTCGGRNTQASLKGFDFFLLLSSPLACGLAVLDLIPKEYVCVLKDCVSYWSNTSWSCYALPALVAVLCKPGTKFGGSRVLFYPDYSTFETQVHEILAWNLRLVFLGLTYFSRHVPFNKEAHLEYEIVARNVLSAFHLWTQPWGVALSILTDRQCLKSKTANASELLRKASICICEIMTDGNLFSKWVTHICECCILGAVRSCTDVINTYLHTPVLL